MRLASAELFSGSVPNVVLPVWNVTVPLGRPDRSDRTEAFNVTGAPTTALGVASSVVVVPAGVVTAILTAGEMEAAKFVLPP
jgi:hypothetical protein